ncbi:LOW QUALITY PROTEIN: hypothetical protein V1478_013170 [Vespula squamosa]|uniref:Uncharacterized protein n=1 Tax=Vespula squamosa TaxID=30214 RepID=A0ABD2ACP3_VESSQ
MQVPMSLTAFAGADTDTESVRNILWHVIPMSERKTIGDFIVLLFGHLLFKLNATVSQSFISSNIGSNFHAEFVSHHRIPFKSKMTRPLSKSRLSTITISILSTLRDRIFYSCHVVV